MASYEPVESPDATTVFPYHDLEPPTTADVYRARPVVRRHLPRTPLVRSESLSAEFDADVYLKREDTLPTGAFKVRGGVTLVSGLAEEFRDAGLVAASTGNHGGSVAWAGRAFDVPVTVVMPAGGNESKAAAMRALGAEVVGHGAEFDDAREHAERLAVEEGYRLVHSANEHELVAGVGTAGLEIVEELPDLDYLFCPIGGGSSASGYCLTVGATTDAEVIGAGAEAAPAAHDAWTEGHLRPGDRNDTLAEGIATRAPFAMTQRLLADRLDEFVLVPDEALLCAVRDLFEHDRILMEGACGASVAAMRTMADEIAGSTVALPVSGRNVERETLLDALGS